MLWDADPRGPEGVSRMALRVPMALLAVLLLGYAVQAAETAILTLSCDGTDTIVDWHPDNKPFDNKPDRVANMGLAVNFPEGTVSGFEYVARIVPVTIGEVRV